MTVSEPLAARLRSAYERFLRGDPAPLLAMLADDVVYHLPGRHLGGGVLRGKPAMLERLAAAARWCDPPRSTVVQVAGAGSLVVSLERFAADRPGARVDQLAAVVWRFAADERCVEIRTHFDDLAAVDRFWQPFAPETELHAYFMGYARAFDAGDVDGIARFYEVPCLFLRPGSVSLVESREQLREGLRGLLTWHERAGYGRASFGAISVVDQGEGLAFVTVPWVVHDATGQLLWRFAVSYNLVRRETGWTIAAATTQPA